VTTAAATSKPTVASGAPIPEFPAVAYRVFWALALTVLLLDQLSKLWIVARLPFGTYGEPGAIRLVRNFFYLVHVGNTGAAWSMFSGRSVLLALLAAATLAAIFFWRQALGLRDRIAQVSFGLLCGGITGNLVDRLLHGHVIWHVHLPDVQPRRRRHLRRRRPVPDLFAPAAGLTISDRGWRKPDS
jgi:lipoprotein signal peptidase